MINRLWVMPFTVFFLQACYLESPQDHRKPTIKRDAGALEKDTDADGNGRCRLTRDTGCIDGQIPPSPALFVEGVRFFDADDLGHRFNELLIYDRSEAAVESDAVDDIQWKLLTPLDNRSFSKGFEVYTKGATSSQARVWSNGEFAVSRLTEDSYEVRVSKPISFEVTGGGERRVLCATLFAEELVEIVAGERATMVIDDFELFVADAPCQPSSTGRVITL